jgi:hypothetical protein
LAINLWKLGGQPTSYNPLPSNGLTNAPKISIATGSFSIRFKAYAKTSIGKRLYIVDSGSIGIAQYITLTQTLTSYEFSFNRFSLGGSNFFYISDSDSAGDFVVTDIELVNKPLGTATINGVDGFGKVLLGDGSLKTVSNFAGK